MKEDYRFRFYFTGSSADEVEISQVRQKYGERAGFFINGEIPPLAALISMSDLFITNDTGVMHVAGATSVPQISIFGPTNPFNWAPIGPSKYFIRKSELINDVSVEDVLDLVGITLKRLK